MTHHRELLVLARRLLKRPSQAALRRAVSTAYYALFHLLIYEAVRKINGAKARHLDAPLSRTFEHARMKEAATAFAGPELREPQRFGFSERGGAVGVAGRNVKKPPRLNPPPLKEVATTFIDLQEARIRADYDPFLGSSWSR